MTQQVSAKRQLKLVGTSGYSYVRIFHDNITANARQGASSSIRVPGIVSRAKLIQKQQRLVPTINQQTQDIGT